MKKVYVSWHDVQRQVQELVRQMWLDKWTPDYVVGITRGGLTPANLISQYLDCPMETLKVRLRDGAADDCESNLWMAEDAFHGKNILIVDDINDSGATLNWIKKDWQSGCSPNSENWRLIWGKPGNVRVAVLYDNTASQSQLVPSYAAETINKLDDPQWVVFPWEEWWRRWNPDESHLAG
jgi:hypoxanthine phosphoribosyltransferase